MHLEMYLMMLLWGLVGGGDEEWVVEDVLTLHCRRRG